MELKDRLTLAIKNKGIKKTDLAKAVNVSRQTITHWCAGRNEPNYTNSENLAKELDVSGKWLRTGNDKFSAERVMASDEVGDVVYVFESNLEFSCGSGNEPPVWVENKDAPAAYRRDFFTSRGIHPENCLRIKADGDSMMPLICDGDRVLFVKTPKGTPIKDGKIYAIGYGGTLRIKRLYRKANGDVVIRSDNDDYDDETIQAENVDKILSIYGICIERSGSL